MTPVHWLAPTVRRGQLCTMPAHPRLTARIHRAASLLALPALVVLATGATEPPAIELWNGRDLTGWDLVLREPAPEGARVTAARPDSVLFVAGRPVGYLVTLDSFSNYELTAEWRWTSDAPKPNSGFLLHIPAAVPGKVWPTCLQVQLKAGEAGDLLPMDGFTMAEMPPAGAKGTPHAPGAQEAPAGQWNTCRIVCRGDTVECWINGVQANRATKCSAAAGRIGILLEGAPFEVRHLKLRRLE